MADRHNIAFGTDGWRAIIADGFTIDNLERVALATAAWVKDTYPSNNVVVLGHDARFGGKMFTDHAARVLASQGLQVIVSEGITATPVVSWAVQEIGAAAGVVITASHNPPEYNGYKIKGHFGGSALPSMVKAVEARLEPWRERSYPASGAVSERDFTTEYCAYIRGKIDLDRIRAAGLTIVHDAMHGSGMGMYTALLGADHVVEHRSTVNPSFGGVAPEPIEKNLIDLPKMVVERGASAGIANDGDADRIGMVDERGHFVDSHRILALLVDYLHTDRGESGTIVKTFSTTDMLDKMGAAMGLTVETTAIGFKYIGEKILDGDVLVGGEESGGMAVKGHIPERDGIFIGMLVLEMMAVRGKSLGELVDDLYRRFGPHAYHRVDAHTTVEGKERILGMLRDEGGLREIGGLPVQSMTDLDGYKHRLDNGWLLIRPSGTEPVLRVYAEAPTEAEARALVEHALLQLGVGTAA